MTVLSEAAYTPRPNPSGPTRNLSRRSNWANWETVEQAKARFAARLMGSQRGPGGMQEFLEETGVIADEHRHSLG
jgi:hypothetical protein